MELFAKRADFLDKFAFHPAVNIFRVAFQNRVRVFQYFFQQRIQRAFKLALLIRAQHADGHQRFGPGDGADNVLLGESVIKAQ